MVRKFSPLIQMVSTDPASFTPASFSPRTMLTASTVSFRPTRFRVMSYLSLRMPPTNSET